jgi:hypothetical protein
MSSEGQPIDLPKLSASIIDFVSNAGRSVKVRQWFDNGNLYNLVDALAKWSQITKDNVISSHSSSS